MTAQWHGASHLLDAASEYKHFPSCQGASKLLNKKVTPHHHNISVNCQRMSGTQINSLLKKHCSVCSADLAHSAFWMQLNSTKDFQLLLFFLKSTSHLLYVGAFLGLVICVRLTSFTYIIDVLPVWRLTDCNVVHSAKLNYPFAEFHV